MTRLLAYKLEYYWYEGEHNSIHLAKDVTEEEFIKDLQQAIQRVANLDLSDSKYDSYHSLPSDYREVIAEMEELGYQAIDVDDRTTFEIDEEWGRKLLVSKKSTVRETIIEETVKQK